MAQASAESSGDRPEAESDEAALQDDSGEVETAGEAAGGDRPDDQFAQDEVPAPTLSPEQIVIAQLRAMVIDRDEKLKTYITAYKEAMADVDREKERLARERQKVLDRERMDMCSALLDVLDNLDRSRTGCATAATGAEVGEGLDMVSAQFLDVLRSLGVERIDAVGSDFDHNLHEASGMIPAQGSQRDQEVVFEERGGYMFGDQLLRPARVVVATRAD
jgi:molecular chaperone GrpE